MDRKIDTTLYSGPMLSIRAQRAPFVSSLIIAPPTPAGVVVDMTIHRHFDGSTPEENSICFNVELNVDMKPNFVWFTVKSDGYECKTIHSTKGMVLDDSKGSCCMTTGYPLFGLQGIEDDVINMHMQQEEGFVPYHRVKVDMTKDVVVYGVSIFDLIFMEKDAIKWCDFIADCFFRASRLS